MAVYIGSRRTLLKRKAWPANLVNFVANTALVAGLAGPADAATACSRTGARLADNTASVFASFPTNMPRLTDKGLRVDPTVTSAIRNPSGSGASAGTPGTPPTNYAESGSVNGLVRQVFASGTANGIAYSKTRWSGTPSINFALSIIYESTTGIAAAQFEEWLGQIIVGVEAGGPAGMNGCAFSVGFQELTAAGAVIGTGATIAISPTLGAPYGSEAWQHLRTMINATCGHTRCYLQFVVTAGVAVDLIISSQPFCGKTNIAPTPVQSAGPATENGDVVTLTLNAPAGGGFIVNGRASRGEGSKASIVSWNDGTSNNEYDVYLDEARFARARVVAAGVEQCNLLLEEIADGALFEVAFAWTSAGRFSARLTGDRVVYSEPGLTVPTGLTTVRFGSNAAGNGLGGYLTGFKTFKAGYKIQGPIEKQSPWQQAGTLAWTPDDVEQAIAGYECKESWSILRIDMDCTEIRFGWAGYWVDITDVKNNLGNDQQIQYSVNLLGVGVSAQIVPATFGGAAIGVIPNGGALYFDDGLTSSQYGLAKFGKGTLIRLQQRRLVPTGGSHAINLPNVLLDDSSISHDGSLASQVMSTAAALSTLGVAATGIPNQLPVAFICLPVNADEISVALSTDSIGEGYGDATFGGLGDTRGDMGGAFQRACYALGYAVGKTDSRGGTRAVQAHGNDVERRQLNQFYTHKICQRFTNDAAVAIAGQVLRANRYIAQRARKSSCGKIRHVDVVKGICRGTSSNGFVDAAGQTVATNFQDGGNFRAAYAAMVDADTTGMFDGIMDPNADLSYASEHGKWGNDAGVARTGDGTHPNEPGHIIYDTSIRTPMAAYT